MTTRTVCPQCAKRRTLTDAGKCYECSGIPLPAGRPYTRDESPAALPGRWVPNGRGTLDYAERGRS